MSISTPRRGITVVGLGPGDPRHLTASAREALDGAEVVYLRTARHPSAAALPDGVPLHTFDDLYAAADSFQDVYRAIADQLVEAARNAAVVYAVPGDPTVGETSVALLREAARTAGVPVVLLPGVSFIEPTLQVLGWDALDGLQVADATALAARHHPDLDPDRPALVAQLYGRMLAGDVKLALLGAYPADHPVTLVSGAGAGEPRVETVSLAELDHEDRFDDLTTLAVPPAARPRSVTGLAEVVGRLRAPDGCPWDREQTHLSLRPYLLEETYEVLAALDAGDDAALVDEMGDLLLQIVLHAQLAAEDGAFTLADVAARETAKIVRRHPHVFGQESAATADDVRSLWEDVKAAERSERGDVDDPLAGVPRDLPALARVQALVRKAGGSGLDRSAPSGAGGEGATIGRRLWELVLEAETTGVDAEAALREAAERFQRRPPARGRAIEEEEAG